MSIVIFGDIFSFPEGLAATNRIYTYAKGFSENGIKVYIICLANEYTNDYTGTIEGITYFNTFKLKKRSKYFIVRRWHYFIKYFRAYRILWKIRREEKILALNRWTNSLFIHIFAWLLSKHFGTKLVSESSEHPFSHYQNGLIQRKIGEIKFYIESRLCDGVFCISRYLVDFHFKRGIDKRKLFLVPSTVDPNRFIKTGKRPVVEPYIGYFGSLTFKRDNVDVLIKAFARFSTLHPSVMLVLGGFCSEDQKKQILHLIDELNIESKVKIVLSQTREEVVRYIVNADILVMVRAKDISSDASYPSKLTEFLASGKPVVSVNVGEVSDFLEDGINAFLCEPENVLQLAEKLDFIVKNPNLAEKIGKKGKELTTGIFNYKYQAKRMLDFIYSLYRNKI